MVSLTHQANVVLHVLLDPAAAAHLRDKALDATLTTEGRFRFFLADEAER